METITKLQKKLEAAQEKLTALEAEKAEIKAQQDANAKRMKEIDKEMRSLVGRSRKTCKRAKNDRPLSEYITDILKDKDSMHLSEISEAVLAAGYKSKSKDGFLACVATVLGKDDAFAKVERGVYKLA